MARAQGFESWDALVVFAASVPPGTRRSSRNPSGCIRSPSRATEEEYARSRDWDEVIAVMQERRLPGMHASGQMTDAMLERVSQLEHITALDLDGSKAVTDDGVRHLARMPHLGTLNLMGCGITNRGLEVLRQLPALETVGLGVDAGHRRGRRAPGGVRALRTVDLSGTTPGDGAIRALAGKGQLCDSRSGNGVTDAGLALLHEFPVFKRWQGGEPPMALSSSTPRPNFLMLRGPFTDSGMAQLAGLDGLFAFNVDSDQLASHRRRTRAAGRPASPRVARLRCQGRFDAAHCGPAAPPLPDVSGHGCR